MHDIKIQQGTFRGISSRDHIKGQQYLADIKSGGHKNLAETTCGDRQYPAGMTCEGDSDPVGTKCVGTIFLKGPLAGGKPSARAGEPRQHECLQFAQREVMT